jgi:hypothetical protein
MCISVFAVLKQGRNVLVGIPKPHKRWTAEWVSGWLMYSKEELNEIYKQTRLPSSYLFEGEHPDQALRRVMLDQLGIEKFSVSASQIMSYYSPSDWYPRNFHWDLIFVYEVGTSVSPRRLPWWRELVFLDRQELRKRDLGWNEDMMKDLKLV